MSRRTDKILFFMACALLIVFVFSLTGCVTSYQHFSDPTVNDDGYDLLCGGVETQAWQLDFRGDVCRNVAPNGGTFARGSVEYRWGR